jgi:uncharacterized protein (DUF2336 family)
MLGRGKRSKKDAASDDLNYEESKELARHEEWTVRRDLARRTDVKPEILYYLAEDESPEVRREIALNASTPAQADLLLANDVDDEVRVELARKISRLLPTLSDSEKDRLGELTLRALELLAEDQLPRVRSILSEELKHSQLAPKKIVQRLARDVEEIVSVPVLQYSPLLNDQDLLEIIASGAARGALKAISQRDSVSEPVSDAIVATMDVPAVAALLANPSAQIREETLDAIIDNAADTVELHEPLVYRPELSLRAVRRIASFVALSLVSALMERNDLDQETVDELNKAVRQRIEESDEQKESAKDRAEALAAKGELDDEAVCEAIQGGDKEFVRYALAIMAQVNTGTVDRVLNSKSPKPVTSLCWRAGLSMRTAMNLQLRVAKVPPTQILNAKDGVDYPLSEAEMLDQLDLFSI